MIIFIILFILFFSSSPACAQELIPYQNNPIVANMPSHNGEMQPFVLREQNVYSLWYADYYPNGARIARMQSANGIDWYDYRDTNVTNRKNASDPFVFINNNQYELYFASSNYGPISLWKSVSSDGITFTPGQEKEILKSEQEWERYALSTPALIQDKSTQYLFYGGAGAFTWAVGVATSTDGQTWHKCENNPFISAGVGAQVVKYNDVFYLYFHSPNGLEVEQTDALNGCDTVWTNRRVLDSPLRDAAPIVMNNELWVYGSYEAPNGIHIGLAAYSPIPLPTYPIVIIPGMFASWNKDAILHNTLVSYGEWNLNPAVTEYDALEKTLEKMGRTKNVDYFLFPYDWRAPLTTTVNDLNQFLQITIWNNRPLEPIQLIGHSLGGVITRLYAQKNGETKLIKNIATAGSPQLGAVQSYKPLAGGEIDRGNTLMWMAEKLILLLNKSKIESDKDTITRMLPVLYDLIPTFPYLKNENGDFVTGSLNNETLSNAQINSSVSQLYLGGTGTQINAGYVLGERTPFDILLNNYLEGHPISSWTEDGDGTVLFKSTMNQITPAPTANHGEVIYSKENIKTILSSLNIAVQDGDIPEGKGTSIFPAILAFIQSPATIEIEHNGTSQKENEGMVWVQNAENGTYYLTVEGTGEGEYTANLWLIGENNDQWIQFKKTTSSGSKDTYEITFDETTGGTAKEYVAPSPTPTSTPTPTPLPTATPAPTSASQSSSNNSSSSKSTNSESTKPNETSANKNTGLTQFVSSAITKLMNKEENKKPIIAIKKTIPQVLGASNKKENIRHFSFAWIFFIKQILWGACVVFFMFLNKIGKIEAWLKKRNLIG